MSYAPSGPFAKRRKGEDTAYTARVASGSGTARTSRAATLAAQQAASTAEKNQARRADQGEYAIQLPAFPMSSLPPQAIHKYLTHYNLIPPFAINQRSNERPIIDYSQAVQPQPAPSIAPYIESGKKKRKAPIVESDGEDDQPKSIQEELRTPAAEGQEPSEADSRLCDVVKAHWEKTQVKEGETIVQFMFAVRMKDKLLKAPSMI